MVRYAQFSPRRLGDCHLGPKTRIDFLFSITVWLGLGNKLPGYNKEKGNT